MKEVMHNPPKNFPLEKFFTGGLRPLTKNIGTKQSYRLRKYKSRNNLRKRSRRKGGRSK